MWLWPADSRSNARLSSGDLVLVREAAEDLPAADPVLGEVDLRWPGVRLSRWQLAESTMRPGGVVMLQGSRADRIDGLPLAREAVTISGGHGVKENQTDGSGNIKRLCGPGCGQSVPTRRLTSAHLVDRTVR